MSEREREHIRYLRTNVADMRLRVNIEWLEGLIDVADNDPDFEGSWLIPTQILDWRGYDIDYLWSAYNKVSNTDDERNAVKTRLMIGAIRSIIEDIQEKRARIR